MGARAEPRRRTGPGRPGRDHRAGRLTEPEPGRPDPRLQPATAAASGRAAQRVQPAPGAAPAGQDALPTGDDADAGGDERRHVLRDPGLVHPALRRGDAADDAGERERVAAPAEEALPGAGQGVRGATRTHRTCRGHLPHRRARQPAPQLPRPCDSAALRHWPACAAVGATTVGPGLPAPADRHDRPAFRRDDQGPDPRGP